MYGQYEQPRRGRGGCGNSVSEPRKRQTPSCSSGRGIREHRQACGHSRSHGKTDSLGHSKDTPKQPHTHGISVENTECAHAETPRRDPWKEGICKQGGGSREETCSSQRELHPTPPKLPPFLQKLLPYGSSGDLLALLILLLLLSEGREDAQTTILTLLIFLFL